MYVPIGVSEILYFILFKIVRQMCEIEWKIFEI